DSWQQKAAEHDAGIHALESERAEREAEHLRLQQLLGEANRPARPPTPVSSPAVEPPPPPAIEAQAIAAPAPPESTVAATPPEPATPSPAPAPPPEPEPRASKRPSPFDEIGFMRAVVGRTTPYSGVPIPSEADLMPRPPAQTPAKDTRAVEPPVQRATPSE